MVIYKRSPLSVNTRKHQDNMTTETVPNKTISYNGKEVPICELQTMNFSRLLSQEPAEINKLLQCCQDSGFFYLDLEDIDGKRMLDDHQRLLTLMRRFFNSLPSEKNEIGLPSLEHGYDLPQPSFRDAANQLQVMSQLATILAY